MSLVLRLDSKLTFGLIMSETTEKLSRLLANDGDPLPPRRELLINVNNAILLYECVVWDPTLSIQCTICTL